MEPWNPPKSATAILCRTDAPCQCGLFRRSEIVLVLARACSVTSLIAAAAEDAPLIEWAVNFVLIPLACFSHRAMVDEVTGLCGEITAKKVADSPF